MKKYIFMAGICLLAGAMQAQTPKFTFCTLTESGAYIDHVHWGFESSLPGVPPISFFEIYDSNFCFVLDIGLGAGGCCIPINDSAPHNGISTYDLVLLEKYLDGVQSLNSPFKIIAADINRSYSVTNQDVVELRKLILGAYAEFPDNNSWRFVDPAFVFPNPTNPFETIYPEQICLTLPLDSSYYLWGIKIGDLNESALANDSSTPSIPDSDSLQLFIPEGSYSAGQDIYVEVSFNSNIDLDGWQWKLQYDSAALKLVEILPASGNTLDNFAVFQHSISASWAQSSPVNFAPFDKIATLHWYTKTDLLLSEKIKLEASLRAEAYTDSGLHRPLGLVMGIEVATHEPADNFSVTSASPNPTNSGSNLNMRLRQDLNGVFRLSDLSGRVVYVQELHLKSGQQTLAIPPNAMTEPGIYFWQICTEGQIAHGKIVKQ